MSWSGFKKNVGRATTQVMMKTGQVEKTTDRDYEVEERRYRTLESASLRLQKEAKGYLDSLRAMTASQMRIAETIDAFYGDSGAKDGVSRSYKQAVEDLDAETVKALDGPYRCVPASLREFAMGDVFEGETVREAEREWNFTAGNRRKCTRGIIKRRDCTGFETACELMDHLYRTTVLEPINRFCAYFPDINECIKKRQHKMLDYDALRSKVKKLTEKPDKDPAKLPRTEKEMDMVSKQRFLTSPQYDSRTSTSTWQTEASGSSTGKEIDLSIPSPPKALQRPEIEKLRRAERGSPTKVNLRRSPSLSGRSFDPKSLGRALDATPDESALVRSASATSPNTDSDRPHDTESLLPPPHSHGSPAKLARFFGTDANNHALATSPSRRALARFFAEDSSPSPLLSPPAQHQVSNRLAGPFFQPSELEEIMEPLRREYIKKLADELAQAKAAYEQLNEQLTSELPQLIDLRVPYLDPSFEALVKIQLRFCAEAYSRMAQVQQYLDASTRDQYASGDLDARVEDVLGQIRELSIAGTV